MVLNNRINNRFYNSLTNTPNLDENNRLPKQMIDLLLEIQIVLLTVLVVKVLIPYLNNYTKKD